MLFTSTCFSFEGREVDEDEDEGREIEVEGRESWTEHFSLKAVEEEMMEEKEDEEV